MILSYGGTTVIINHRHDYPYKVRGGYSQAKEVSGAGVVHVEHYDVKNKIYTFKFAQMATVEYQKLIMFSENTVLGMLHPFDLTDDLGVLLHGRFLKSNLIFSLDYKGLWSGSFDFEVVS